MRWTLVLVIAVAAPGAAARPAAAQEVYLFRLQGRSDSHAFASSGGFALAAALRVNDWLRVDGMLGSRETRLRRVGRSCVNPLVSFQCTTEPIDTRNTFRSVSAALVPYVDPVDFARLSAGLGIVLGTADSEGKPESGRMPRQFVPRTLQAGVLGRLGLQLRPVETLPLVLAVVGESRRIAFEGCHEDPDTYAPACGSVSWQELRLGVGIRF